MPSRFSISACTSGVLFPWMLSGNGNNAGELVDDMRHQHVNIAAKMKSAMALASRLPLSTTTCLGQQALYTTLKRLESEFSNHIHMENTLLYPRALGEMRNKGFEIEVKKQFAMQAD
jgi:regulator of cell morphogenesis and NO signaling